MSKRVNKSLTNPASKPHRQRSSFRVVTLSLVIVAVTAWILYGRGEEGLRLGQVAPEFTLSNALGGEVRLSDYQGKQPVLLYFSMGPG